jgi:integration host factor subunit beta
MTKKELAKRIAEEVGSAPGKVLEIVQRTFDGIIDTLEQEGRLELRNFGVFAVKRRKPRQARNPRTGEKVSVPEKFVVTFEPGREMRERIGRLKEWPKPPEQAEGNSWAGP